MGLVKARYSICGIGFILYLAETHRIQVKGNVGRGTNNQGEFKAMFYLLNQLWTEGLISFKSWVIHLWSLIG
jgi:ribonuclease HI